MLRPYRVLDLTDADGWLAGFLLAQLGADVFLGEPSGGFERTAGFDGYNRGKRSVIVEHAERVSELAGHFDVIIDNGAVAGFDAAGLQGHHDHLVTVSLSPFGGSGPKADWVATDLTLVAASGQMALTGDRDRPPVRTSVPQAWAHGASDAAVGALVALYERERSGRGQHVDVSVQQSFALAALPAILHAPSGLAPARRESGGIEFLGTHLRWVYPALDGHVAISLSFGPMIGPFQRRLMEWVREEGHCDQAMLDKDWVGLGLALTEGTEPVAELEKAMDCIEALTSSKTKAQLLDGALERKLLIAPVSTMADVVNSPQLAARGFWDTVDGELHPGPIVRASASPLPRLAAAPPQAGGSEDEARRGAPGVSDRPVPAASEDPESRPLAGLKVLDMAWVAAAPLASRLLAYWGATVVRVESSTRPDLTRIALGHRDDIPEVENAITWQVANAGKLTVALDLAVAEGHEVVEDLAVWADVVIESFAPGVMGRLGLDYDSLRRLNPSLIMLSSCVMGQDGPWAAFAGFGNLSAAVAGFFDVTGWPDRPPAGPYMAYTDYTSPRFIMLAMLAALDHRARTGEGQYLDLSQMEAATHLLTPALLECQRTGHAATRMGNLDPTMSPHAVYRALGDDEWIAIACATDEQWASLAQEMRRSDLAGLTMAERIARRDELDGVLSTWAARQSAMGMTYRLEAIGVPAHMVQNSSECVADAQHGHRQFFVWRTHHHVQKAIIDTPSASLSRTPGSYGWAGAGYGEHTYQVLTEILGYDDDKLADLAIAGALQ